MASIFLKKPARGFKIQKYLKIWKIPNYKYWRRMDSKVLFNQFNYVEMFEKRKVRFLQSL